MCFFFIYKFEFTIDWKRSDCEKELCEWIKEKEQEQEEKLVYNRFGLDLLIIITIAIDDDHIRLSLPSSSL